MKLTSRYHFFPENMSFTDLVKLHHHQEEFLEAFEAEYLELLEGNLSLQNKQIEDAALLTLQHEMIQELKLTEFLYAQTQRKLTEQKWTNDFLMEESTRFRDLIEAQANLINHYRTRDDMNQEPAPLDVIDLLALREAVDKYNEIDAENSELNALPKPTLDAFNEIVRAMNAILQELDPGTNLVNPVDE